MWNKFKVLWEENYCFYKGVQLVGLVLMYNVMYRHGITFSTWDFWIASIGTSLYGAYSMLEGYKKKDKSVMASEG